MSKKWGKIEKKIVGTLEQNFMPFVKLRSLEVKIDQPVPEDVFRVNNRSIRT